MSNEKKPHGVYVKDGDFVPEYRLAEARTPGRPSRWAVMERRREIVAPEGYTAYVPRETFPTQEEAMERLRELNRTNNNNNKKK